LSEENKKLIRELTDEEIVELKRDLVAEEEDRRGPYGFCPKCGHVYRTGDEFNGAESCPSGCGSKNGIKASYT